MFHTSPYPPFSPFILKNSISFSQITYSVFLPSFIIPPLPSSPGLSKSKIPDLAPLLFCSRSNLTIHYLVLQILGMILFLGYGKRRNAQLTSSNRHLP